MRKRLLLILLSAALFLPACSSASTDGNSDSADITGMQDGIIDGGENIEAAAVTVESVLAGLPDADYEGYIFTVMTANMSHGGEFEWRQAPEETETGEPINDALFRRARLIEEKYNINFEYIIENDVGAMANTAQRTVRSGDNAFDIVIGEMINVTRALAQAGHVYDFVDFPNVDLSQPWWVQNAMRDLMINNRFFFPTGDITPRYVLGPYFLMFNKTLFADRGLEIPYNKVLGGTWTLDELYDLTKDQTRDLNGDGVIIIEDDFFGMFNAGFTAYAMMVSSGENIIGTENGNPFVSVGNERSMNIIARITDILTAGDIYYSTDYEVFDEYRVFSSGRALFIGQTAAILHMYRDMDHEYGVIPLPKFDLAQENYYSYSQPWDSAALSVPITNENTERTGMIVEAMAAVGKYTSTPAQYNITLQTKFSRDEYTPVMLDIICETATFDLGHIYNFGGVFDALNNSLHSNTPFVSQLESILPRMEAEIERTINSFAE